jgi:protein-tyrosine-phosphatase
MSLSRWVVATPVRSIQGKRYMDWEVGDPAGKSLETVREIRDAIGERVEELVVELVHERAAWQ